MKKATFYHAGCPVCIHAENELVTILDASVNVAIVHLGEQAHLIPDAEQAGVRSVPALVLENGNVLHINHGATIEEVKS